MSRNREDVAETLAHRLRSLQRTEGPLVVDGDGLWLLVRPRLTEPWRVARELVGPTDRHRLAAATRSRALQAVDAAALARRGDTLRRVRAVRDAERLIKEGYRVLRPWRGRSVSDLCASWQRRLEWSRQALDAMERGDADALAALALAVEPTWSGPRQARLEAAGVSLPAGLELAWGPCGERLVHLYGPAPARRGIAALASRLDVASARRDRLRPRIRRFLLLAHAADVGCALPGESVEDRELRERLSDIVPEQARGIAKLLHAWVLAEIDPPPGLSVATLAAAHRKRAKTRKNAVGLMARLLLQTLAAEVGPPTHGELVDALALVLAHPSTALRVPPVDKRRLGRLSRLVARAPHGVSQGLLDALAEPKRRLSRVGAALERGLPDALVLRALRGGLATALEHVDTAKALERVLDVCEPLKGHVKPEPWLFELAKRGGAAAPHLALAAAARLRGRMHEGHLRALAQALDRDDHGLTKALGQFGQVTLDAPPPEAGPLTAALGLSAADMDAYLHFRRLSGHGETISQAMLTALGDDAQTAEQVRWLRERAACHPEDLVARARLAALEDPGRIAARRQRRVKRARNRFSRALTLAREEALERVIEPVFLQALARITGVRVERLPLRVWDACLLLLANKADHRLVGELLRDALRGRPLQERPANRAWIAAQSGFDVQRWQRGFAVEREVQGQRLRIATEHDPLAVLRMGSYFSTCLSLDGGMHAASTLVNALDINKHVVFARSSKGDVVGRKLVGVTPGGALVGFHAYTSEGRAVADALNDSCREFAAHVGLPLADSGVPAALVEAFWYDDGVRAWSGAATPAGPLESGPAQALRQIVLGQRLELLASLLEHHTEWGRAAVLVLMATRADDAHVRRALEPLRRWMRPGRAVLDLMGLPDEADRVPADSTDSDYWGLEKWLGAPPLSPAGAERIRARILAWTGMPVAARGARCDCDYPHFTPPPLTLAYLPTGPLLDTLGHLTRAQAAYMTPDREDSLEVATSGLVTVLDVHFRRTPPARLGQRTRHMPAPLADALVRVAQRHPSPVVDAWLTRERRRDRERFERLESAEWPTGGLNPEVSALLGLDGTPSPEERARDAQVLLGSWACARALPAYLALARGLPLQWAADTCELVSDSELDAGHFAVLTTLGPPAHRPALRGLGANFRNSEWREIAAALGGH